ncbi:MAG TPA: glycoside hydrolase family 15 protein [Mucilaginibacter sp.]|nr:glycoside hydrolase family 15 protein [Mucilaginibacter sp.]
MKKTDTDIKSNSATKSKYQPIENYGVIGDLNTVALVGLNGSIDFMCFPDFDSPSVFAALLDKEKGGQYSICPKTGEFKSKQLYLPETNILLTRFLSTEGIGELTDFMPVQELDRGNELIRRVNTVKGRITYRLAFCPRFNYASSDHKIKKINDHEVVFISKEHKLQIRLKSNLPIAIQEKDCFAEFTLKAGEIADFIMTHSDKFMPEKKDMEAYISESLKDNINYWKEWTDQSTYNGHWMEIVNRSAMMLKLLTSYKYGSLVAAPTFSLPEAIGGTRNWDYRYTWIRDASFTVYCLLNLGYTKEAGRFIDWVQNKCFDLKKKRSLQIMYKLDGSKKIDEVELNYLEGYKASGPVRIGNAAYKQLQLDIYGELMDAIYLYDLHAEPISYDFWLNLSAQVNWLADNWKKKDDGIWEVRGGKKNFLYSRLMCWVAFDRAIKIAEHHSFPHPAEWREHRDEIFHSIHIDFWNTELKAFVQYEGARAVDAAALMMPIIGFIGPKDPKWLSTLNCIEERLVDDFLVYRYRSKQSVDGLDGHEGTFSMCTFWFIECLSLSGQLDKARLYFEKMLGYANHLGLYSEQLGFSGEHLGNFPQAFTHLGLISAAVSLNNQLNDSRNQQTD